ncbi:MAG: GNAT family N-acetyltransferase [Gammaproteobacteria bacterium]|nr:GNAT family N-acetyltransferase [Gammaproteobacteria bacterium]
MNIHPISSKEDQAIFQIIKTVAAEFSVDREGFGPADPEVQQMSKFYLPHKKSIYYVATIDNKIVGGGGIAAFDKRNDICELRKLFLLPESRGHGIGQALLNQCLNFATENGYQQCYLDTLRTMDAAIKLYEKNGFKRLAKPLEGAEHSEACDVWMLLDL